MLDRSTALEILDFAEEVRPHCIDGSGQLSACRFMEIFLPARIDNFIFEYVVDLRSERPPFRLVSGFTKFDPVTWTKIEAAEYDRALMGVPSALFTVFHEGYHALKHTTAAARGLSGTGTSFLETPVMEYEANFFAGSMLVPKDRIEKTSTVEQIMSTCPASRPIAERQLKLVRAVYPEKWSPGWNK